LQAGFTPPRGYLIVNLSHGIFGAVPVSKTERVELVDFTELGGVIRYQRPYSSFCSCGCGLRIFSCLAFISLFHKKPGFFVPLSRSELSTLRTKFLHFTYSAFVDRKTDYFTASSTDNVMVPFSRVFASVPRGILDRVKIVDFTSDGGVLSYKHHRYFLCKCGCKLCSHTRLVFVSLFYKSLDGYYVYVSKEDLFKIRSRLLHFSYKSFVDRRESYLWTSYVT